MASNPYKTPAAPLEPPPATAGTSGTYGPFRQNQTLKSILIFLLVLESMVMIFSGGVLNYLAIEQYQSEEYYQTDEPSKLDQIIDLTDTAHGILFLTIIVLFAIWINRSCKNGWLLDPPRMGITPGWSVGYYFIPILNLWKPYVAMKQIRSASYGNDHALKSVLPVWWTLWLLSGLLITTVTILYTNATSEEDDLMVFKLNFISTAIDVALNYAAIILVSSITRAQGKRLTQWHA